MALEPLLIKPFCLIMHVLNGRSEAALRPI